VVVPVVPVFVPLEPPQPTAAKEIISTTIPSSLAHLRLLIGSRRSSSPANAAPPTLLKVDFGD